MEPAHEAKESEWKKKLEKEKVRTKNAVKESADLKSELARVKGKLLEQGKAEAVAVEKFKASEAYNQAVADAGDPDVLRCWMVFERHIKADPSACWDSFIEEFLNAKDNI